MDQAYLQAATAETHQTMNHTMNHKNPIFCIIIFYYSNENNYLNGS